MSLVNYLVAGEVGIRGDERRLQELQLLLPALDALIERDAMGDAPAVRALTERSAIVAGLWADMARHAIQRDRRADVDGPRAEWNRHLAVQLVGGEVRVDAGGAST